MDGRGGVGGLWVIGEHGPVVGVLESWGLSHGMFLCRLIA